MLKSISVRICIFFSVLSVCIAFETLGVSKNLPCDSISNNMTSGRHKRETDLLDTPLPYPSEVLDNLFSRRLFNTTMNYIVPCVEVSLPLHTESGSTVHLAMQAFLGLFSAIAWIATVAIPFFLTDIVPFGLRKRDLGSDWGSTPYLEYKLTSKKLEPFFNEKVAKKIGIEWGSCLRKTICQAHRSPKEYGLLAIPFVTFYPPQNNTMNLEQQAAYIGTTTQDDCGLAFRCFYDVLDLVQYLYRTFWKVPTLNKKK